MVVYGISSYERFKLLKAEFKKWIKDPKNKGKYFDKKLNKLLDKYNLDLEDYYRYNKKLEKVF